MPGALAGDQNAPRGPQGRQDGADPEPDEDLRGFFYQRKTAAVLRGQEAGAVTGDFDAAQLMVLVLSIAGWWAAVPQVARMLCGPLSEEEHARRRAAVVRAARRLAAPGPGAAGR